MLGMQQEIMGSLLPTQKEQPPGMCTPSDSAQITDQVPQLIFLNSQKEKKNPNKQVLPPLPYGVGN